MKDKFKMDIQENIQLVKDEVINIIYNSTLLENLKVTFFETEKIYKELSNYFATDKILTIMNLKRAWNFLMDIVEYEDPYFVILEEFNKIVGKDLIFGSGQ